jgi:thioredoxin-like negative regulator of GroEL
MPRKKRSDRIQPDVEAATVTPRRSTPRWLLLAGTIVAPLLVLGLLELGLRLAGVAALEPLFVPVPGVDGYVQPNTEVVRRFFPNPDLAPRVEIDSIYFPASKPPDTHRIVVMGESSAAGFPYGRWASPGEFLHQRLQRGAPDREIEVISVAMSAVTSYVLLDFADEVLEIEPDAVVIYTGHNEYLGIGGVGSSYLGSSSPALARFTAGLRRLHLYRGFERLLSGFSAAPAAAPDGTLMSRVAKERQIPLDSPLYERGLEQFRGNMERLLARFDSAGVPVLLGTLASNERDQPPFESARAATTDRGAWEATVEAARSALEAGDFAGAETLGRDAVARDPGGAAAHYVLAQALDGQGRHTEARAAYLDAKDRDALRFRAPEAINESIRALARESGATLIDVQRELASHARNGIIGSDLMLEHLHPNVRGYFFVADAYYDSLRELAGIAAVDLELAWRERPATEIDVLGGEYRISVLKNDWPFVNERRNVELPAARNEIERIAQQWFAGALPWVDAVNEALVVYQRQGNATEAARVAVNLAEALINVPQAQAVAGRLLLRNEAPERAAHYLARARQLDRDDIDIGLSLAEAQFRAGDRVASAATLQELIDLAPADARPRRWLQVVQNAP